MPWWQIVKELEKRLLKELRQETCLHNMLIESSLFFVLECVVGLVVVLVSYECGEACLVYALGELASLGWGHVCYVVLFGGWCAGFVFFCGLAVHCYRCWLCGVVLLKLVTLNPYTKCLSG